MRVITARNVNHAFPYALHLLKEYGVERGSRNGPVLVAPWPVATVYECPTERVLFDPDRDANPFFHLAESLWMLLGRRDVATPARYAKQILQYSDDGVNLHDAYGNRWKYWFGFDQLDGIVSALRENPEDRRCVLQMWSPNSDYGRKLKAVPCNLTATFQIGVDGRLNMTVFCRSNDIIWGCYGANVVHFSMLLEYMAVRIGVPVGTYTQVSVNWHAYLDVFKKVEHLASKDYQYSVLRDDPYVSGVAVPLPIPHHREVVDVSTAVLGNHFHGVPGQGLWSETITKVLRAHFEYSSSTREPARYLDALAVLDDAEPDCDWVVAARRWITRRYERHLLRQAKDHETLGEA